MLLPPSCWLPQVMTEPSSLRAANEYKFVNTVVTPLLISLATELLSPPTDSAPQVTTEPSSLSAAKEPWFAKISTTPEVRSPPVPLF